MVGNQEKTAMKRREWGWSYESDDYTARVKIRSSWGDLLGTLNQCKCWEDK
jgi:hypothetical protein